MQTHAKEFGERIKTLRLAQNLTLKGLGAKAGVSATHLSEIERGLSSPTVGAVVRIARALGEEPALLVADRCDPRAVAVRYHERRVLRAGDATLCPLGGTVDGAEMSLWQIELPSDGVFDPGTGGGERFLLVLAGSIELRVGETARVLAEGDAIHCAAGAVRSLRAREASRALWVALPPVVW